MGCLPAVPWGATGGSSSQTTVVPRSLSAATLPTLKSTTLMSDRMCGRATRDVMSDAMTTQPTVRPIDGPTVSPVSPIRGCACLACSRLLQPSAAHHRRLQSTELIERRLGRGRDVFVDLAHIRGHLGGDCRRHFHDTDIDTRNHPELVRTGNEMCR